MKRFYDTKEMCEIYGVSRGTIRNMEMKGLLPERVPVSPGRVGWHVDEVDKHVASLPRGIGAPPRQLRQAIVEKKVGRKKGKNKIRKLHKLDPWEADRIAQIHEVADRCYGGPGDL